jgi:polysaccharide deacetylase 2 family uncharacterized protein YibQ
MRKGSFPALNFLISFFSILLYTGNLYADTYPIPVISIIIDDIGYRHIDDGNALKLPGPVAYAIMPHSPFAGQMSEIAMTSGKDIILHLPMEATEDKNNRLMGPGGLKHDMNKLLFLSTLSKNFRSVPHIIGVNNHMGSLLTRDRERMEWLMDYLRSKKVFYIDSVTGSGSIAGSVARGKNVPYLKRDVFLDNSTDRDYIHAQFDELILIAKRKGSAIAIGHPHPETIEVLEKRIGTLEAFGVRLISLREMIGLHNNGFKQVSLDTINTRY